MMVMELSLSSLYLYFLVMTMQKKLFSFIKQTLELKNECRHVYYFFAIDQYQDRSKNTFSLQCVMYPV